MDATSKNTPFFSNAGFQLFSLKKNLDHILPLIKEIFTQASFPENEFQTMSENRKARHLQNMAKNDYLANRIFLQNMWGKTHPYGRVTEEADFEKLNVAEIKSYFSNYYNAQNCFIILSGNYTDTNIQKIDSLFGQADWAGKKAVKVSHTIEANTVLDHFQAIEGAVQSTVMVGQESILKTHPDFDSLSVLNTLFGGYFGSRLMTNIREEKGYTYGVYSSLTPYKNGSIFEVSADVGIEHREATFNEIKNEMQRLQHELVSIEELETVQNYLSGRILRSVDGAFRYADVWKGILLFDKKAESINAYLETIHNMTPKKIQQLAEQYLDFDKMYKVAVG
jgi:zinc protease